MLDDWTMNLAVLTEKILPGRPGETQLNTEPQKPDEFKEGTSTVTLLASENATEERSGLARGSQAAWDGSFRW